MDLGKSEYLYRGTCHAIWCVTTESECQMDPAAVALRKRNERKGLKTRDVSSNGRTKLSEIS